MSYESVGTTIWNPAAGKFEDSDAPGYGLVDEAIKASSEASNMLALINSWPGGPVSRSKITTTAQVSTYAAAGYKACVKKNAAFNKPEWSLAAKKYFNAFVWSRRPQASVVQGKEMLASADAAAAAAQGKTQAPGNPALPIDLSPNAPPVPEQDGLRGAGFMGMSPMMLVVAAGLAYITFFHKGKKSRGPSRRTRRKAKRAYRKR